ncbi:hypothetical protein ACFFRR_000877 [Megaselia abdita]
MNGKLVLVFTVIAIATINTLPQAGFGYKPQDPVYFRNSKYNSNQRNRQLAQPESLEEQEDNIRQTRRNYGSSQQNSNYRRQRYFDERQPYRNPENALYNAYRKHGYAYQDIEQNELNDHRRKYYQTSTTRPHLPAKEDDIDEAPTKGNSENSKFIGSAGDTEESDRTLAKIKYLTLKKKLGLLGSNCLYRSNDAARDQGRFLWDLNVYNYYTDKSKLCGGGVGGGLLGDEVAGAAGGVVSADPLQVLYRPRPTFFQNFWGLFVPGGSLNPVGGNRPVVASNPVYSDGVANPIYNPTVAASPVYSQGGVPVYNDGTAAAIPVNNLTPGQIVGGVASTVNSIIQQLSGNIPRPVRSLLDF